MDREIYSNIKNILNFEIENSEKVNLISEILIKKKVEENGKWKNNKEKKMIELFQDARAYFILKSFDDDEKDAFRKYLNNFIENSTDDELIEYLKIKSNKNMYI